MIQDVKDLGTILGIWAHPDDETFCSGGLMILAQANGQRIGCVTATKGEGGVYHPEQWSVDTIAQTRARELEAAQEIIGVKERYQLDFVDGACRDIGDSEALERIAPIVAAFRPDTIVTFASDGITGHDDHRAVSRWVKLVADKSLQRIRVLCAVTSDGAYAQYLQAMDKKLNIFFNIDRPRLYAQTSCDFALNLPDEICTQKCQALQAMQSQTSDMFAQFPDTYIAKAFSDEYFVLAGNEHAS